MSDTEACPIVGTKHEKDCFITGTVAESTCPYKAQCAAMVADEEVHQTETNAPLV